MSNIQYQISNKEKGFTFIELLLVIGITVVLFGFITFNLAKSQRNTSVNTTVTALVADIKSQQLKAMAGATEGRTANDNYGIYFQSGNYTLFHGMTYYPNPSDHSNFVISTDSTITLSTTLPNSLLIFSKTSGEVAGWSSGKNTITVTNATDTSKKTITINQYGVITSIQ